MSLFILFVSMSHFNKLSSKLHSNHLLIEGDKFYHENTGRGNHSFIFSNCLTLTRIMVDPTGWDVGILTGQESSPLQDTMHLYIHNPIHSLGQFNVAVHPSACFWEVGRNWRAWRRLHTGSNGAQIRTRDPGTGRH